VKLLLTTYPTSDSNGSYDFAIVDLTDDLARKIRSRQQALKQLLEKDEDVEKIEFSDWNVEYFWRNEDLEVGDDKQLIEAMFEALQTSGCVEIDEKALPEAYFADESDLIHDVMGPRMVVSKDGVFWACYPEVDEDLEVETSSVPEHLLARIL
jgi:hypothetical protein